MRIFLDTANIEQIRQGAKLGVVGGVTTNPSLMMKEGLADYEAAVKEICSIIAGPVSVEVVSEEPAEMLKQARKMAKWAPNVIIKIPATLAGLEVTSTLAKEKIKVNLTLCFSLNQAILGATAGAAFISPFVGRLDDIGHNGMELVEDIVTVYDYYNYATEVIAASIRHPQHCIAAAKAGAHIATVPYSVLIQMMQHPLTDNGVARFMADWKSAAQKSKK
ncbi:MAG: fructose-6-phosphate aldolase [Dehalococcoidales bacterium]|nr:fructose-6-phosphate aldolase [Dehalococcoidales bacterium]